MAALLASALLLVAPAPPGFAAGRGTRLHFVRLGFSIPYYRTELAAPRVEIPGRRLLAANRSLRNGVLGVALQYRRWAVQEEANWQGPPNRSSSCCGTFAVLPQRHLTVATPTVVSSLIPVFEECPPCTDSQWWFSDVVLVRSGDRLDLYAHLFATPSMAAEAIARVIARQIYGAAPAPNACAAALRASPVQPGLVHTVAATLNAEQTVGLVGHGLVVGLAQGDLDDDACGLSSFLVPYGALRPYLSPLGHRLIADVETR